MQEKSGMKEEVSWSGSDLSSKVPAAAPAGSRSTSASWGSTLNPEYKKHKHSLTHKQKTNKQIVLFDASFQETSTPFFFWYNFELLFRLQTCSELKPESRNQEAGPGAELMEGGQRSDRRNRRRGGGEKSSKDKNSKHCLLWLFLFTFVYIWGKK